MVEIWGALPIAVGALVIVAVDVNAAITLSAQWNLGTAALYRVCSTDGYCSTVQGLLDWVEVDLGFTRAFIYSNRFVVSKHLEQLSGKRS